eukprot:TRINITY_DN35628_c0_g1_i3.p1 TRINITY_DN35628_c0_g1~~TRINITY_DN35628_c0_g1_i3.p1  ORF type:complete len:131 (-),score=18.00 TRINITY_DN35628_c0_g1_i3:237-629(-)
MDPFLPSSSSVGSSSPPSTEALMEQVKLQLAQAHAEESLKTVRGKCFAKCITKPGTSLAGVKVAASPGVWIVISKLWESLAEHSSVHHTNVQPVILNPSRELQVVHLIDRSSCLTVKHSISCFSAFRSQN